MTVNFEKLNFDAIAEQTFHDNAAVKRQSLQAKRYRQSVKAEKIAKVKRVKKG